MKPKPLDDQRLAAGNFLAEIEDDHLVYFCLSVGDADAQVIVLPKAVDGVRRVIVVDAGVTNKVTALLKSLADAGLISFADPNVATIALVVATHPHHDHIAGMPQLFHEYGEHIAEFWEPGFFHTGASYQSDAARSRRPPQCRLYAADQRDAPLLRAGRGDGAEPVDPSAQPLRHLRRRDQRLVHLAAHRAPRPGPRRPGDLRWAGQLCGQSGVGDTDPRGRRADLVVVVRRD